MKKKNKIFILGSLSVIVAFLLILFSFGVPDKGLKVFQYQKDISKWIKDSSIIASSLNIQNYLLYQPFANCIKKGLSENGMSPGTIAVFPNIANVLNNFGYLVYYLGQNESLLSLVTSNTFRYRFPNEVRFTTKFCFGQATSPPGGGIRCSGYAWEVTNGSVTKESRGLRCTLDTNIIEDIVKHCLEMHRPSLDREKGRIFIATTHGFIVFNSQGDPLYCRDWFPGLGQIEPFEEKITNP